MLDGFDFRSLRAHPASFARQICESSCALFPICIGLGYATALIAYLLYFAIWEPARTANMLANFAGLPELGILLLVPIVTLAWLFGAFVAMFYLGFERLGRISGLSAWEAAARSK